MSSMRWCSSCTKRNPVVTTELGHICCTICGKIIDQDMLAEEVTFVQSRMQGSFVKTVQADYSISRERTLSRAYDFITHLADNLGVGGGDLIAQPALRFYEIAVEKNFVRGRRSEHVAAACLYISCRNKDKPFLLIEFSEFLRVNVYVLGAVFLQLCKALHLQEHPIVRKLIDPSLFIHRFSNGLLGEVNHEVEKTALHIMTSMKRDWMQTGRKPSGLCGAALYISAISHGYKFSKADVVKVVHICEATLTKRLIEFEGTESASLTIEEFNNRAEELERTYCSVGVKNFGGSLSKEGELLCEHKGSGDPHFAHGLCDTCYKEFIKISGGLDGGSEPPAFQRAERERLAMASRDETKKDFLLDTAEVELSCENQNTENETIRGIAEVDRLEASIAQESVDGVEETSEMADRMGEEGDESDNFSDIDDAEVIGYLHNEEETQFKKIIWEEMNREYLEEQAAKKALGALNVPKSKKERQKRASDGKNPQTAAEAAHQMLTRKRVSSKLNHERLEELFKSDSDNPKRSRSEILPEKNRAEPTAKNKVGDENSEDGLNTADEYKERNVYGDDQDNSYYYDEEGFDDELC